MRILIKFKPKRKKDFKEFRDILELLQSKYHFNWNLVDKDYRGDSKVSELNNLPKPKEREKILEKIYKLCRG